LITLLLLPLFARPVHSLGVLQKHFEAKIEKGEGAEFHILFWNTENFDYPVELSLVKYPEDMYVGIFPKNFELNPENEYEDFEYIAKGDKYIRALKVKVLVKAFSDTKKGKKEILIKALAGKYAGEKTSMGVFQERFLPIRVYVNHADLEPVQEKEEKREEPTHVKKSEDEPQPNPFFWIKIAIVLIILLFLFK
jgi:hypothetical protein